MIVDVSAMVFMAVLFLVAYAWVSLLADIFRGKGILPFEPRRPTPWGFIAVILSFVLLIGSQIAAGLAFGGQPDVKPTVAQTGELLTWTALAILAATLTSLGLTYVFARADLKDLGISLDRVPQDVFSGVYAFLILAPVTFAIQYVFVSVLGLESHHPLIELLKQDTTGRLFGVVTLLAVVVAPISEEYFFRVLLQGWLERIFLFRITPEHQVEHALDSDAAALNDDEALDLHEDTPVSAANPYVSPTPGRAVGRKSMVSLAAAPSVVPIVISAAFFALMHWSHGPDPAALFVLALGLGYLYQRTHRWLPSVVTHACLNGTTMLLLWFGLDEVPS